MSFRFVSQFGDEPLLLADVKAHLRVDHSDDDFDIIAMIRSAREQAELHHGRELAVKQFDCFLQAWPAGRSIELLAPLVSIDTVCYTGIDGLVVDLSSPGDYVADVNSEPGKLVLPPGSAWPSAQLWPASPIRIRFTAGIAPEQTPELLRRGMLMLIAFWYDNRAGFIAGPVQHELPFATKSCFEAGRLVRY